MLNAVLQRIWLRCGVGAVVVEESPGVEVCKVPHLNCGKYWLLTQRGRRHLLNALTMKTMPKVHYTAFLYPYLCRTLIRNYNRPVAFAIKYQCNTTEWTQLRQLRESAEGKALELFRIFQSLFVGNNLQ